MADFCRRQFRSRTDGRHGIGDGTEIVGQEVTGAEDRVARSCLSDEFRMSRERGQGVAEVQSLARYGVRIY